jgi:hypothetical protein
MSIPQVIHFLKIFGEQKAVLIARLCDLIGPDNKYIHRMINNKKEWRANVFVSQDGHWCVVQCTGNSDKFLNAAALLYGAPRGAPIVFHTTDDEFVPRLFGFMPKFENDRRKTTYNGSQRAIFTQKLSGYLGLAGFFEYDGAKYCACFSKNAATDSVNHVGTYVLDLQSMVHELFVGKTDLVDWLIDNQYHMCFEVLSYNDQNHGARVLKNGLICTCIMRTICDWTIDNLNHRMGIEDMVKLCVEHGIPCLSVFVADKLDNIAIIFKELNERRNVMTASSFVRLMEEMVLKGHVTIVPGNASHHEYLGDRLEGLVITVFSHGIPHVLKYKFLNYTWVTFALRNYLAGERDIERLLSMDWFNDDPVTRRVVEHLVEDAIIWL